MDYANEYFNEVEEIRKNEPELLIKHTAEMQEYVKSRKRKVNPPNIIAHAIMDITSLYAQAIKKARGGWSCGTHMNHVRAALANQIASKYDDSQLRCFIDFCVGCADGRKSVQAVDNKDIKDMVEDLLAMRPEPLVHPPLSWFREILENKKDE